MTGLLAGISGQLPRRLLLGTLLPVVVFVLAAHWALEPWWRAEGRLAKIVATLEPQWQLALSTLAAVLVTGLLHALNIPLIRLHEGYGWEKSFLGKAMAGRERRRRWQLALRQKYYGRLVRTLVATNPRDARLGELRRTRDDATRRLIDSYPKQSSVLPTRLGNTIRAFENYPERQYGFSGIALWPRLVATLPESQASQIDAAKTRLDFMLNASVLSFVLALLLAGSAVASQPSDGAPALLRVLGCLLLTYLLYRLSVGGAAEWGSTVKAAFDLRRRDLLKALGCEISPATLADERALWKEVSRQIAFIDSWDDASPQLRFREKETAPTQAHDCLGTLDIARGVQSLGAGSLEVVIEVRNPRSESRHDVEVRDIPPEGWALLWDSPSLDGQSTSVSGTTPLRFSIPSVPARGSASLTYTLVRVCEPTP